MALALAAVTRENITRITGTVSGGAGGSDTITIFSRSPAGGNQVNSKATTLTGAQPGTSMDRVRTQLLRFVGSNTAAGDYLALKNLDESPGPYIVCSFIATGDNYTDDVPLWNEFRNGLQITATTAATANDSVSGVVFELFVYHNTR